MNLELLYTLTGSAVVENLGKVQDGERIKIEFRGTTAADSPLQGTAHGSTWILVGSAGPGATSAVQEVLTPDGARVVVELQGYSVSRNGGGREIRTCGMIRSSAAAFDHLNGRIAVVIATVAQDNTVAVRAYHL